MNLRDVAGKQLAAGLLRLLLLLDGLLFEHHRFTVRVRVLGIDAAIVTGLVVVQVGRG